MTEDKIGSHLAGPDDGVMTHNPAVDSTLGFAADLERRDDALAHSLAQVERLQADVDELRAHAEATRGFLDALPELIAH